MQIHRNEHHGTFQINRYEPGCVVINQTPYHASVLVGYDRLITDWPPTQPDALKAEHIAQILELRPEVVLLGTGPTQQFPDHAILAPLYQAQLGVEIMDSAAACRTYNLLVAEARKVVAALIV